MLEDLRVEALSARVWCGWMGIGIDGELWR